VAVIVAVDPEQIATEFTVTVGNGFTVTRIVTGSPTQPEALVSTTCKVAVPVLVQLTEIRLGVAPAVIVPLPPVTGVMVQR
jgi:hypothetical protein